MGLFSKKFCDICGSKIGLFTTHKLGEGKLCPQCFGLLSPFMISFMIHRGRVTLAEIKEHLAYREANKKQVATFNVTQILGYKTKVLIDDATGKFIITSSDCWRNENPDVMALSQVIGCQTNIREHKNEIKYRDNEGRYVGYDPPRYSIDYDFFMTIHINSPWFNKIEIKINNNRILQQNALAQQDVERNIEEIKTALTRVQQEARDNATPKGAVVCPLCGATTIPDTNGCCEYCDGSVNTH